MPKYEVKLTVQPKPVTHTIEVEADNEKLAKLDAYQQYQGAGVIKITGTEQLFWIAIEGFEIEKTGFVVYELARDKQHALEQFRLRQCDKSIKEIARVCGGAYSDYPDDHDYEVDEVRVASETEVNAAAYAAEDPY